MRLAVCKGGNLNNQASTGQADSPFRLLQGEALICIQQVACLHTLCHPEVFNTMFSGLFDAVAFHAMLCYLWLYCTVICHAAPFPPMLRHLFDTVLFRAMMCHFCHAKAIHAMLWHTVPWCGSLCHALSFHAMLCHPFQAALCCTMLCHALLRSGSPLLCSLCEPQYHCLVQNKL